MRNHVQEQNMWEDFKSSVPKDVLLFVSEVGDADEILFNYEDDWFSTWQRVDCLEHQNSILKEQLRDLWIKYNEIQYKIAHVLSKGI